MLDTVSGELVLSKGLYTKKVKDHIYTISEDINIATTRKIDIYDAEVVNNGSLGTESPYILSIFLRMEQRQV
jgi:hypothetical protein